MEQELIAVLERLVSINSVNPGLPGGVPESAITDFIHRFLSGAGITATRQPLSRDRENIVVVIPGKDRDRPLLLNAHVDTVGVEFMTEPFRLRREGDRLYGRGTYDMKGSAAVMMLLAKRFKKKPPAMDLVFTFVADEEVGSIGMSRFVSDLLPALPRLPAGGIFMEPTEGEIGIAHKGIEAFEMVVHGRAAHGSRPEQGVDAILPVSAALAEMGGIEAALGRRPVHPLLGRPNIHAGTIAGGSAVNVIPAECRLTWERRTLPGEGEKTVLSEFERILAAVRAFPGDHTASGEKLFHRPAYEIAPETPVVRRLKELMPGTPAVGLSFWTDAAIGSAAGIPSVIFGPAGHGAHAVDEWVSLESLVHIYRVLERFGEMGWADGEKTRLTWRSPDPSR